MRSPRRLLAGAAAALSLCLAAAACDSSPFAASVNGQVITQSQLDQQLAALSANKVFVQSLERPSSGGSGIQVTGQSQGSYTAQWTAAVLTASATATAVRQHLEATRRLPHRPELQAAWAVDAAAYNNNGNLAWYGFSSATRSTIARRDADMAMLLPVSKRVTESQLRQIYHTFSTSLFTRVCLRTVDVAVSSPHGGVDFPASLGRAKRLVTAINHAGVTGANSDRFGGSVDCYGQEGFAELPISIVRAALSARAGSAATPTRTGSGYEVVAVTSRRLLPFGPPFIKAVSVASEFNSLFSVGSRLPQVDRLLSRSHVRVDPLYGKWSRTRTGWAVVPPAGPAAHAAGVAGSI